MVAETHAPGSSVSMVARRYDVNANLLFTWRRQAARGELGAMGRSVAPMEFVPISVMTDSADDRTIMSGAAPVPADTRPADRQGLIEILLPAGIVVRVDRMVDSQALQRVLLAVKGAS